jgi:hypothetical protein
MKCKGSQPTAVLGLLCVFAERHPIKKTFKLSSSVSSLLRTELYTRHGVKEHGIIEIDFVELLGIIF